MQKKVLIKTTIALTLISLSSSVFSFNFTRPQYYVAANAGIFTANMNEMYRDQTDIIQQNFAETIQQNGYTAGIAGGFRYPFRQQFLLGGELSMHWDTHAANYFAGASSASFTDTTQVNNHLDLVFVPGILIEQGFEAYGKLGFSYATVQDNLQSPTGFLPTMASFNSTHNALGFAAGLGVRKFISDNISIFAEGNYHDYGSVSFAPFTNYTANYSHTAQINTYDAVVGVAYHC